MRVSILRSVVGWLMLLVVPVTLLGQQAQVSSAIVHTQGGVWVNGYEAKDGAAVFPGDAIETKVDSSTTLSMDGSSVLMLPETVGKFQGDMLVLNHGSVSVETSKSFKVRVNCLTVIPVRNEWTQYDVIDVNRTMKVAARKLDVNVQRDSHEVKATPTPEAQASQEASVHEGEQKSYDETAVCGPPAEPTTPGSSLNPKWIAIGAGGAGLIILIAILGHGGGGKKTNVSPSSP
jgi:hypothetical protein